jgi:hypothetical protein
VLNEFIGSDEDELNRFADTMFARFAWLRQIRFGPVDVACTRLAFPHQRMARNEDIVLSLPATVQEYNARLGKSTRQNIQLYRNRLRRDFSSFDFRVVDGDAIGEEQFRAIIGLSRARMAGKAKAHSFDEQEVQRLFRLARQTGVAGIATIDGRVCGGTICFKVGDRFFLEMIAHDPAYDYYRLGTYVCYLTICECIARGATHYHFLWGREEYKYRLLGEQQDFERLAIYRSRLHYLLDMKQIALHASRGHLRRLRLWLLEPARRNHPLVKAAIGGTRWLRRLRQSPSH